MKLIDLAKNQARKNEEKASNQPTPVCLAIAVATICQNINSEKLEKFAATLLGATGTVEHLRWDGAHLVVVVPAQLLTRQDEGREEK